MMRCLHVSFLYLITYFFNYCKRPIIFSAQQNTCGDWYNTGQHIKQPVSVISPCGILMTTAKPLAVSRWKLLGRHRIL